MLRTLVPDETELIRLCMSKRWIAVSLRSQTHPHEAAPSELAVRGKGTTALGIAVRSVAPRDTIQLLVEANMHQLGIAHVRRGNIIIEALRHRAPDEVLDYLLRAIIHYQSTYQKDSDILGAKDDLGRTALHYMVERARITLESGLRNPSNEFIFRNMLLARPDSVQVVDCDGNTPLILLMLLKKVHDSKLHAVVEEEVFRMVHLMVSMRPHVASIPRALPVPWHELKVAISNPATGIRGDGSPTPLYYAVLHGRSLETIQILIAANRKSGNASATIVTQYQEVPLHAAIQNQAPVPVVIQLLQDCPESSICADIYGLTPIDWMWIRHVVDWYTGENPRSLSKSRHLGSRFSTWHRNVSRWLTVDIDISRTKQTLECLLLEVPRPLKGVTEGLLDRMKILLPATAAAANPGTSYESWSLLHAVCCVPCPAAMVHLALEYSAADALEMKDEHSGRLPIHHASSRLGAYAANFPVGFTQQLQRITEKSVIPSLVSRCVQACAVLDKQGQLPLHIALDASLHYRGLVLGSSAGESTIRFELDEVDSLEFEAVNELISAYPGALECRDGKSQLLPFQQAAIGRGARLDTIYLLLRESPSLVLPLSVDYVSMYTDKMEL